jgi:hypothetical protein
MNTAKFLLYTALGVTAVLLLTSDQAKEMRSQLEEKAKDKAKKWKNKMSAIGADSREVLADIQG